MLFLLAAAVDFILFAMHFIAVFVGADAYLFLRAGKVMAQADASGQSWSALLTFAISLVFFAWSVIAYWAGSSRAFANVARYLVIAIGCVFLLRGGVIVFQFSGFTLFSDGEAPQLRDFVFSISALLIGLLHLSAAIWRR